VNGYEWNNVVSSDLLHLHFFLCVVGSLTHSIEVMCREDKQGKYEIRPKDRRN